MPPPGAAALLRAVAGAAFAAGAAAQTVDCEAEWLRDCQVRTGPADQSEATYEQWRAGYNAWKTRVREKLEQQPGGFSAYDEPALRWTRTDWVQVKTMLHDRLLFDRDAHDAAGDDDGWRVDRYLADFEERYGGVESVVPWPFYPNSGVDDRNQFDMFRAVPGGVEGVRKLVAEFHRRGKHVMWPVYPWDWGTRPIGAPEDVELVRLIDEVGADGVNGDTLNGVNVSWWEEGLRRGRPLALEAEIMQTNSGPRDSQGFFNLVHNVMSWGQGWGSSRFDGSGHPFVPLVSAYKSIEPRHMVHLVERWAQNRTNGLQTAFFNGMGYIAWENVWCIWNGITDRDAAALRRVAAIYRHIGGELLAEADTAFSPHVPVTLHHGLFASEFARGARTLWAVVNRGGRDAGGDTLRLECRGGDRFFDVYHGIELGARCGSLRRRRVEFAVPVEAQGYGAVLRTSDGSAPDPAFLAEMAALSAVPLAALDATWRPLAQGLTAQPPARLPKARSNGMVLIPAATQYDFRVAGNFLPVGTNPPEAIDVQYPWEDHPQNSHAHTMAVAAFYIDETPVTNAAYAAFLAESGWRPPSEQGWLSGWEWGGGAPRVPAGEERLPVVHVSRHDALAYCRHYGRRLPEEWEWQYAAQGTTGGRHPWGNTCLAGNCEPAKSSNPVMGKAYAVDAHPNGASPFGVLDMSGNVYQWTSEFCDKHTCRHMIRGGNYYAPRGDPRFAIFNYWYVPQPSDLHEHHVWLALSDSYDRSGGIGFRCAGDTE